MTDCTCGCATFGNPDGSPHDAEARHPRPRSCAHDEEPKEERIEVPFVKWTDAEGNTYIAVPHG